MFKSVVLNNIMDSKYFREWLQSHEPNTDMGDAGDGSDCPVHRFLTYCINEEMVSWQIEPDSIEVPNIHVGAYEIRLEYENDTQIPVPEWYSFFLDHPRINLSKNPTAQECTYVMEEWKERISYYA